MIKTQMPKPSARPYTPPRLICPDAEELSPEGKLVVFAVEYPSSAPS